MAIAWEDEAPSPFEAPLAFARARRGRRVGLLTDGFASARFAHALLASLSNNTRARFDGGEIQFHAMPDSALDIAPEAEIEWPRAETTNSSLIVGRKAFIKLLRRVSPGIHPEAEMSRVLTERGFAGVAPLLGEIDRGDADGAVSVLAIIQSFVANQGDGATWSSELLTRIIDAQSVAPEEGEPFEAYQQFAHVLGRRTGEMHAILASPNEDPDFAPEEASERTVQRWHQRAMNQLDDAFTALGEYTGRERRLVASLSHRRDQIERELKFLLADGRGTLRTRIHGDFHLGQVLVTAGDVIIIDFEGEPTKPLSDRRAKLSPLRDVAGMIRSFDYVAGIVEREGQLAKSGPGHARAHVLLDQFRKCARHAFLTGYEEGRGLHLTDKERRLITAFAIEKAAYEITYEAANRPDWIEIPLRGLAALIQRTLPAREFEHAD
jgi:maltose alpha-D-glucosyltransferase/alpha-amylase